jgi:hypothetical protein
LGRRFGDKGSLVAALLGDRERDLQDRVLSGPPPLGPGAPPRARLEAYNAWRLHVAVLLEEAAPDLDAVWFADLLLAPLDAARHRHQRRELGLPPARIASNLTAAVDRVAPSDPGAGRTPSAG